MFDQVKLLYDSELWSSITQLAPYALPKSGLDSDINEAKSSKKRHLMLVMLGDAFYETREFR